MAYIETFVIQINGSAVIVHKLAIGKDTVFRIMYPNKQPLVITKAKDVNASKFWTSIPQGRHQEAEVIGNLIEEHLNKLK